MALRDFLRDEFLLGEPGESDIAPALAETGRLQFLASGHGVHPEHNPRLGGLRRHGTRVHHLALQPSSPTLLGDRAASRPNHWDVRLMALRSLEQGQ